MSQTTITSGSNQESVLQGTMLATAFAGRKTNMFSLRGKFPKQTDAEGIIKGQTEPNMPIVVSKDLTAIKGGRIKTELVQPIGGYPIMGEANASGKGDAQKFDTAELKIDLSVKIIDVGGKMTQQRSPWNLYNIAKSQGLGYHGKYEDQMCLVHLGGARGTHRNIEWLIRQQSDPEFAEQCINPVKCPTKNRHFLATSSGIERVAASGNEISIATTDGLTMDVVDAIATQIEEMPLAPSPIMFPNDDQSTDKPMRVLLVSPAAYNNFLQSSNGLYRTYESYALARGNTMGKHPLFGNGSLLFRDILIVQMNRFIRFSAGNAINWAANYNSETETTTDLVPAAFSAAGYAVDRCILLGAQALAVGYGGSDMNGSTFYIEEEHTNFNNKHEIAVGMINGVNKIRFNIDHGDSGKQYTDLGAMCIDTAVKVQVA